MLIRSKVRIAAALCLAVLVFISFADEHPAGNSGAPGDDLCTSCHSGGGGVNGTIDISGVPSVVNPTQTYDITMTLNVSSGNPLKGGFQVVSLIDANNSNAGDFFNNGPGSSLINFSGREYFGHKPAQDFGGGSSIDWTVEWTPPNINGDVTFYAAGNLANGNGSSSGDRIITNTLTVTVDGIDPLTINIINSQNTSCFDGNDGSATAMAEGGMPPYDFLWDNGENSATAFALDAGNHTVTVTDDDGNTASTIVFIDEPSQIESDIETINVSCFGEDDGFADINPFGGTGNIECDWSDGLGPGCIQDFLDPGLYFITLTDENNCMEIVEVEIFEPEMLSVNLSSTDETVAGAEDGTATAIPSGGTAAYEFIWSNGENDIGLMSTITDLAAGLYTVTVIDNNGCSTDAAVMVDPGQCDIDAMASVTHVNCFGDSTGAVVLTVNGATDPVSYNWSNGATTKDLVNIPSGIYSVEIQDAASCTTVINGIIVNQPDSLKSNTLLVEEASCDDTPDGAILLRVSGGVQPYDMVWSNGATNDTMIVMNDTIINIPDTLAGLLPGTYSFELWDANLCYITDTFEIVNGDSIPPVLMLRQGMVFLDSQGMAQPADFSVIDAGSFDNCGIDSVAFMTPSFNCGSIMSHSFPVEIFDAAGNSDSAMATVMVIDTIAPIIDCSIPGNINTNSCDTIGYELPVAEDNCTIEFFELVSGLPPGSSFPSGTTTVTYRATDECGNFSECSFNVNVDIDLEIELDSVVHVTCFGGSNGEIYVSATGGTAPYEFDIEGDVFTGLSAGSYTVTVSDGGGCMATTEVQIEEAQPISVNIPITDVSCAGGSDGSIDLSEIMDNMSWVFSADPNMLSAGEYEITITDEGTGCSIVQDIIVNEPEPLILEEVIFENALCHDSGDCFADFVASGGTAPYTGELVPTNAGCNTSVSLVVSDDNGCTVETQIDFEAPDPIEVVNVVVMPQLDDVDSSGAVNLDVIGGTGPYIFEWQDEDGTVIRNEEDLLDIPAGIYTLNVTDSNGCNQSFEFTVDLEVSVVDLDLDNETVLVSPNPGSDKLYFKFNHQTARRINLYSISGALVKIFRPGPTSYTMDISMVNEGLYLLYFEFEDKIVIKKIAISR